mmetsp:Transcript_31094/g.71887  ORF Transcript_31094/g.71887 Transcript_31094/m.71887 type:complete len:605 (+) Transcript_31094:563-2377(+)
MKAVNASFFPGEAVALMGPSGAGKTTLLNILACRAAGKVSGRVTINDAPASPKVFKQIANFIPQDDILIESLTPRQALEYIALLRLSGDVPKEAVKMHLDQLVQSLGLKRCEHSPVGDPLSKGLSGGQRKRVSIAMELVNQPSVLFLDEPTSGLDSQTAYSVIESINELTASNGLTTICTIHQPPVDVFLSFDRLLLLEKGAVVYSGPPAKCADFFASEGFACPPSANPADYFFKVLNEQSELAAEQAELAAGLLASSDDNNNGRNNSNNNLADLEDQVAGFPARWKAYATLNGLSDDAKGRGRPEEAWPALNLQSHYERSQLFAACVIFIRSLRMKVMDMSAWPKDVFLALCVGLMFTLVFYEVPNDQQNYGLFQSVIFMSCMYSGMVTTSFMIIKVPLEKVVIVREYQNGYYALWAWYAGSVAAWLTLQAITSTVFCSALWIAVGFHGDFLWFLAIVLLIAAIGTMFGYCLGLWCKNAVAAQSLLVPSLMPMIIFCGFLFNRNAVKDYFWEFWYISFFRYAFMPLIVNEFSHGTFDNCELAKGELCPLGYGKVDRSIVYSAQVLDIPESVLPDYLYISLGYLAFLIVVGYYFIRYQARKRYG